LEELFFNELDTMQQLNDFIIITGALTSGKSTLCHDLSGALRKFWNIAGILSFTSKRNFASKEKSLEYSIYSIHNKETLAWAKRNSSNERFVFLEEMLKPYLPKSWPIIPPPPAALSFWIILDFMK